MKREQIPFDSDNKDKEKKDERAPYETEDEKLARIRAAGEKKGVKGFDGALHLRVVDDHKKKYRNE